MTNITQLLNQIDPLSTLEQDVLNVLTEFMDDYLTDLIKKVCELAQHRGSKNVIFFKIY